MPMSGPWYMSVNMTGKDSWFNGTHNIVQLLCKIVTGIDINFFLM